MQKRIISYLITIITALTIVLTGCGEKAENKQISKAAETDKDISKEADKSLNTSDKTETTGKPQEGLDTNTDNTDKNREELCQIMINRLGYSVGKDKLVLFQGKEIPKTFKLMDTKNSETVFEGEVRILTDADESGDYIAEGDFTSFDVEGEYYISVNQAKDTNNVANSDGAAGSLNSTYFRIEDDIYSELLEIVKNKCIDNINMDALTREDAIQLSVLMMSYEIFPEVMENGIESTENSDNEPQVTYIIDEIRNILDSYLLHVEKDEIQGTEEAENIILVATDMAYIYRKYDKAYAEKCLKAAETLWKNVRKDTVDSTKFTALDAAKLYRVTAKKEYKTYLTEYFNTGSYLDEYDDVEFLIETTYLNSRVEVDKNICELLMKKLMRAAEKISNEVRSSIYMTVFEKQTDLEKILNNGMVMSFVDYVISNHEYDMVLENYLHYLLGRNPEGVVYLDDVSDAKIVFMLSKILGKGYAY